MKRSAQSRLLRLGSIVRDTRAINVQGEQEEFVPILAYP